MQTPTIRFTKPTAFELNFSEPMRFSNSVLAVRGDYAKEHAMQLFGEWEVHPNPVHVKQAWVWFGWGYDDNGDRANCWWLEDFRRRTSKEVWVYDPYNRIDVAAEATEGN